MIIKIVMIIKIIETIVVSKSSWKLSGPHVKHPTKKKTDNSLVCIMFISKSGNLFEVSGCIHIVFSFTSCPCHLPFLRAGF